MTPRAAVDVERPSVMRAAAWAGVDEVAAGLPSGYDTQLGKEFSGGVGCLVDSGIAWRWQEAACATRA